jgi:hypothetical protein
MAQIKTEYVGILRNRMPKHAQQNHDLPAMLRGVIKAVQKYLPTRQANLFGGAEDANQFVIEMIFR